MFKKFLLAAVFAAGSITSANAAEKVTVAWSHYTGWEPWGYIADKGIAQSKIEKSCGAGSTVKIELVNDYVESINLYTTGKYDAVAVTNMDVLTIPGIGGVKSDLIIIGDYSDGNDAIISGNSQVKKIVDLKGKKINLVEFTVSHYMLVRALESNGLHEKDVTVVNTSDADIGSLYGSQKNSTVVTWNPIVMSIKKTDPKANVLFTSDNIEGEIIDALAAKSTVAPCARQALRDAWFETVGKLKANDPALIAFLANQAGGSVDEYKAQVVTTHFFWTADEADTFVKSPNLKGTSDYVRKFLFSHNLFGDKPLESVGIRFPDGYVMGNKDNVVVSYVTNK